MSALATGLAERVGIELPTFDEAKNAVGDLAAGLGSKISGMWDSVTGLFKTADEKQAQIDQRNALEEAKESGLYTERGIRKSLIDESQLTGASDTQLQAIISDNDLSGENMEKVQAELARRSVVETTTRKSSDMLDDFNAPGADYSSADIVRAKQQASAAMGNNTTPLGMSSESIPATVETAALSAMTTASTLTYVPSRVDVNAREAAIGGYRPSNVDKNNISTSTLQQGASSVMHSDAVQLYTQKTMMLQQQGVDANTANAQVTAQMLSQNNTSIVNNQMGTNSLFYPVEAKDHTSSWNGGSSS